MLFLNRRGRKRSLGNDGYIVSGFGAASTADVGVVVRSLQERVAERGCARDARLRATAGG